MTTTKQETLLEQVKRQESFSPKIYLCSKGKQTIGYGLNVDAGISERLASKILEWQLEDLRSGLSKMLPFWGKLTPRRQDVFINMALNLGVHGFIAFRRMLEAADKGNVAGVCAEMADSKWAKIDVPDRAKELIEQYREG